MSLTPQLPRLMPGLFSDGADAWASLPLTLDISPLVLAVLTSLVGIFIAGISVILVYHWRRFPFEHDTFIAAERIYMMGVGVLLLVAVVGILFA